MNTIIAAFISELTNRSISFLIDRHLKPTPYKKDGIQRLQWMLLRVHLMVEEADGRCLTNLARLKQLNIVRRVMHKSYYMLDTFIQHVPEQVDKKEQDVSCSLSLSKLRPAKEVCFTTGSKYGTENLEEMLESLENTIAGMSEFLIFLRNYPPMFRQPYSTYLLMEKCMFSRQMEMAQIINFLLYEDDPGHFGILPIVGPGKVGKTALVEHVCRDKRVTDHFSHVIVLHNNEFREDNELKIRDGCRTKHQHGDSKEEKKLVIIELVGTIDEGAIRRLYSALIQCSILRGSKVIITSQSGNIINIGTTYPLNLKFLSREAFWYFFKALVFGTAYPEEHPKLASLAMAIFDEYFDQDTDKAFGGPFIFLNKTAMGLKSRVNAQNWNKILECFKNNRQKNEPGFKKRLSHCTMNDDHIILQRVCDSTQYCVVDNHDRIALVNEEAPKITLHDILDGTGSVRPSKFDILVWESHLPPYHKYIYSCQILKFDCSVNKQGPKRKFLS
ncbi:hypothetical protein HU200_057943 [Digitaria exilis]|uniref:NB-ARC domain-containing protein n=1 Tax=Digitaria exilis TaxID=1010633 RepID=A0A835AEF8_9POAL|nr:hypothetical protein HU200_057943 [Digitaria exilis]